MQYSVELAKKEDYILSTTYAARKAMKEKQRRDRVMAEQRKVSTRLILLAAVSNMWLRALKTRWEQRRKDRIVSKYAQIWKKRWLDKRNEIQSGKILANTLHEWSLMSLSDRVALGLRHYIRSVRCVQRQIGFKLRRRRGRMEALERLWNIIEQEEIDKEKRRIQEQTEAATRRPRRQTQRKIPLDTIPVAIRNAVLQAYLKDIEKQFYIDYCACLEQMWPVLIQLLHEQQPDAPRAEAKRTALNHQRTFTMRQALYQLCPSMENAFPVFSLKKKPMAVLIQEGRQLAFPDEMVALSLVSKPGVSNRKKARRTVKQAKNKSPSS